jgi:hypothetical protein
MTGVELSSDRTSRCSTVETRIRRVRLRDEGNFRAFANNMKWLARATIRNDA